jgi:HSP20 family protein
MAGLVPFNRRTGRNLVDSGFEDFYNLLDDFFTPRSLERGTFKMDVQENDKEYIIEAEVPGVKKEEISLELNDGQLSISINRDEKTEKNENNYVHRERRTTSMSRSVYLADPDPEGINAKLNNGVLTIDVKKATKPETSHKINID